MSNSTYIMKCGCELQKEEILYYRGALRCPNHRDFGINRIRRTCIDCQAEFEINPFQTSKVRCNECRAAYAKLPNKNRDRRRRKKQPEQKMDISLYTSGLSRYLPGFKKEASA